MIYMPVFFVKDTANTSKIKKTLNETDFKISPCVLQSSQNAIEKNTKNGVLKVSFARDIDIMGMMGKRVRNAAIKKRHFQGVLYLPV
ncbi:hypothetical protein BL105A_1796 [Bifidobacterium longum]|nr:hypothetical protein BL105A_1796 [Bifidobacterium longum]